MSQIDISDVGIKEEYESDYSTEPSHINLADKEIKIEEEPCSSSCTGVHKDIPTPQNINESETDTTTSDIDNADSEMELEYEIDYSAAQSCLGFRDLEDNINNEAGLKTLSVNIPCNVTYNILSGRLGDNIDYEKKFKNIIRLSMFAAIEREPKMLLGIPKKSFRFIKQLSEILVLPIVNILITLKKIKLNETFSILALQFGCKQSTISRIFSKSVVCMAGKMKELIKWPTPSTINRNLPIFFIASYSNVVSIIDCLEIEFEKPLNAKHEEHCWSNSKKCHVLKYLISFTPDGLVSFISEGFSGGATDVSIVKESGFLDHLLPNTAVMAVRRFVGLSCLLEEKSCSLITLPLISKTTPSVNKNLKLIRIHIERLRCKLREFNILLPACFDDNLIPVLDSIVVVACGIINVQYGYKIRSE